MCHIYRSRTKQPPVLYTDTIYPSNPQIICQRLNSFSAGDVGHFLLSKNQGCPQSYSGLLNLFKNLSKLCVVFIRKLVGTCCRTSVDMFSKTVVRRALHFEFPNTHFEQQLKSKNNLRCIKSKNNRITNLGCIESKNNYSKAAVVSPPDVFQVHKQEPSWSSRLPFWSTFCFSSISSSSSNLQDGKDAIAGLPSIYLVTFWHCMFLVGLSRFYHNGALVRPEKMYDISWLWIPYSA